MTVKTLKLKRDPFQDELSAGDQQQLRTVNEELLNMMTKRSRTLELLEKYAEIADNIFVGKNQKEAGGCMAGAAGGVLTTVGGIATIATGGLAAPLLLTGLAVTGTSAGIGGAVFNIWNTIDASKKESELKETLKNALAEDVEARQKLDDVLDLVDLNLDNFVLYCNGVKIVSLAANCFGNLAGSDALMQVLAKLLPSLLGVVLPAGSVGFISSVLNEIQAVSAATPYLAKGIAEEAAETATKEMLDGFSKRYVNKIAKQAAEKALKEAATETAATVAKEVAGETTKETARSAAKEAAKAAARKAAETMLKESGEDVAEAVVKAAAKKAGKEAVQQVATEAAEEAAKAAMKTAAKVTGAVTVGFGVLSAGWDGYNAIQSIKKVQMGKSELGDELRQLIGRLK